MSYNDRFLDALGRWQRGWRRDPVVRGSVAQDLLDQIEHLPAYVREHDGTPLYRKRNLYRSEDQKELAPLFVAGRLDEGSPTSWSTSVQFAENFGPPFDDTDPSSTAGAIFKHVPQPSEVILNIPRLWRDPEFVGAAESYRDRDGKESKALFHFRNERDQFEVVLRAPLLRDEIYRLARFGSYEGIYEQLGAVDTESQLAVDDMLAAAKLDPLAPRYLTPDATQRVIDTVFVALRARLRAILDQKN
ncbi:MAG: hypothetical protein J0I65_06705 [Variovorax sp.]|nr:hypothetical protein [Variovorax sp.]|tara:strand:- start:17 stop:754 length:738 start_codon:yes stop_codon:yes gene_type:complete